MFGPSGGRGGGGRGQRGGARDGRRRGCRKRRCWPSSWGYWSSGRPTCMRSNEIKSGKSKLVMFAAMEKMRSPTERCDGFSTGTDAIEHSWVRTPSEIIPGFIQAGSTAPRPLPAIYSYDEVHSRGTICRVARENSLLRGSI